MGFDPSGEISVSNVDQIALEKRTEENKDLHCLLASHCKRLEVQFDVAPFAILYVDPDECILSMQGHDRIVRMLESASLGAGASLSESRVGTTAPGVGLIERRPATVIAEQHYSKQLHWASCFSVPIWDHEDNILGCLNFTSTYDFGKKLETLIPYFCSIANSLRFELFLKRKLDQLQFHDAYFSATFDYADKILILANRQGEIINLNAMARTTFGLPSDTTLQKKNLRELLELCPAWTPPPERGATQLVKLRTRTGASSVTSSMTSMPIFNKTGNDIVYLIKLETEKTYVAVPARSSNTARFLFRDIIGASSQIQEVIARARKAAKTHSNILIEGETGTGKELFAHAIHNASPYCNGPFVAINCSAIPRELIESELFGYERGAYTGARREGKEGKFELANRGTIFLDEIHAMHTSAQMKLLRVLEDRHLTRVGASRSIPLDLRVISASATNLEKESEEGRFLSALFFRLNVVKLHIPSLRDRKEDIPALASFLITELRNRFHTPVRGVSPEVLQAFSLYTWPGNVRELRNFIEYALNFAEGEMITLEDVEPKLSSFQQQNVSNGHAIEKITKQLMEESLTRCGDVKEAADFLGISVSTFYRY
jgi:transcriptional regulator with PAS, ATPase and Fis domain